MQHSPAFLALVEETMPRIREISPEDTYALHQKSEPLLLLDVREDHEWEKGHIAGAEHLARGILERDIENRAPNKKTAIVLYCGGGYRSAMSADNLQKMGYTNVYSMAGGWRAWCDKGLPRA